MREHHSRRETAQTGSNFRTRRAEFPFDPLVKESDSVGRAVFHVGLSYLFYPWGFIVQGLAIVHFVRRRPENYWFYIIFFDGFLGASVYIVAEVLPDLGLLRDVFQGFGRRSRIEKVETDILDNPSVANYEELGELYKDQGQYEKARDAFNHAITGRSDSIYTFYSRAQASLGMRIGRKSRARRFRRGGRRASIHRIFFEEGHCVKRSKAHRRKATVVSYP